MSFTSWTFLAFVLVTLAVYYLFPKRWQWTALLAANIVFYLCGGVKAIVYLLFTTATTYAAGLLLAWLNGRVGDKAKIKKKKKMAVAVTVTVNFLVLFFLKYWSFTVDLIGLPVKPVEFVLPLGISFFIFQSIGYVVDCYRGKYPVERNFFKYFLFLSFFPQMVQGPISRHHELAPQLTEPRSFSADNLKYGIQRAMWGYFKKLVIAERAGVIVSSVFSTYSERSGSIIAVGVLFYCIQLYCDFSGGIDITCGVAEMFGIHLAENFKRPIFATSLADYWRRWHITLGTWMRDYLFYPLSLSKPFSKLGKWTRSHIGGKLGKLIPASVATFIVYFVIGIWHGANLRYVFFGVWNGAIITLSFLLEGPYDKLRKKCGINPENKAWKLWQMLRTSVLVFIGRYVTRAPRLLTSFWMIGQLFVNPVFRNLTDGTVLSLGLKLSDILIVLIGQAAVIALEAVQEKGTKIRASLEEKNFFVQWAAIIVPLAAIIFLGVLRGSYIPSAFIYQQY